MSLPQTPFWRGFAALTATVAFGAVALQFALTLDLALDNGRGIAGGVLLYLGYFTILTNALVALALAAPLVAPDAWLGRFFARRRVLAGVAAAIAVVGIVYSLALRHIWDPQGWQRVADHLLHDVVPLLFLAYWWYAVPKARLRAADIPRWLAYPVAYLAYILARGAATGLYPYPFIDVNALGYAGAIRNALVLVAGFVVVGFVLIALDGLKRQPALLWDGPISTRQ